MNIFSMHFKWDRNLEKEKQGRCIQDFQHQAPILNTGDTHTWFSESIITSINLGVMSVDKLLILIKVRMVNGHQPEQHSRPDYHFILKEIKVLPDSIKVKFH